MSHKFKIKTPRETIGAFKYSDLCTRRKIIVTSGKEHFAANNIRCKM